MPTTENEFLSTKTKKMDSSIANWITRSSVKQEQDTSLNGSKYFITYN